MDLPHLAETLYREQLLEWALELEATRHEIVAERGRLLSREIAHSIELDVRACLRRLDVVPRPEPQAGCALCEALASVRQPL